jgi:hypothetical protein
MDDTPNESESDQPETFEEGIARLKGEADAAGKAFMAALATYVEAVKQHHGEVRWGEGFNDGWEAAQEHYEALQKKVESEMRKRVAGAAIAISATAPMPSRPTILGQIESIVPPPVMPTAAELVEQYISENPGKRGVEIANNFEKHAFRLPERTVRTALHRLKKAEKIKIVDGRWYAAEAAPADPQLTLKE